MADLAIGVARSVVEGTLTKAQAAIDEESKLRQDTQRDLAFITGELQMMKSFLGDVDEERAKNKIVKSWAGQVRDLAYDVEDGIELVAHLDNKPDWWRRLLPGCMAAVLPLDKAAAEIKQLKPRTVDVSHRITQYGLTGIIDMGSRPIMHRQLAPEPDAASARDLGEWDLAQLILKENDQLAVISVWGKGSYTSRTSLIRKVYQDEVICQKYKRRGCIRLTHPFSHLEFVKSLVTQLYTNYCLLEGRTVDVDELRRMTESEQRLNSKLKDLLDLRYLLVLENLCKMVDWDAIRACLPTTDRNNGSCIIVSTEQRDIATLCIGNSYETLELKQDSLGYHLCLFFKEDSQGKEIGRVGAFRHDQFSLVGRESQMNEVRNHLIRAHSNDWHVMSVWGIAGVGKSSLIRSVYSEIPEGSIFDKFGWVHVSHPFNLRDLSRSLLLDFQCEPSGLRDPIVECHDLLNKYRCLVVIDDVKSTEEWDLLQPALVSEHSRSVIIVITTEETIATHCADNEDDVINIRGLYAEASFNLFRKQVERKNLDIPLLKDPEVNKELEEIILKCGGLPKVIVSVADYLASKKTIATASIRTLNRRFMHSLQCNSEFVGVRGLFHWLDTYIGTWPDFLKQCILYLSVFSRDRRGIEIEVFDGLTNRGDGGIRRRRLLRRWIAEGYIKDSQTDSAEKIGEWSFSRLFDTCITEPSPHSVSSIISDARTDLFQINRFVGQYILSRPAEENLFFELDESCTVAVQRIGRHLSIRENWARDKTVFESIDFSRLRSLTVSGRWESFFISESMKVLRVLDLEDSSGVTDKDLEKIVNLLSRLKFLSLRGCREICCLPHRLGDLRQLETLDVRGTSVVAIPRSTMKLKKLQYMRVGNAVLATEEASTQRASIPRLPEGIEKLTLLTTLGVFDISASAGKGLRKLTQLRKLGVSGINKKNFKEFCDAILCHVHLESLSLCLSKENQDCLDDMRSHLGYPQKPRQMPLQNLENLKIHALPRQVPRWISNLPRLTKLELEITILDQGDIRILGEIKELCILRLCVKPLIHQDGVHFCVGRDREEERCFSKLKVLDITSTSRLNVSFGSLAMQNLELLTVRCCSGSEVRFFEVNRLSKKKLKEVRLIGSYDTELKNDIEGQLQNHPRKPLLKLLKLDGKALINVSC